MKRLEFELCKAGFCRHPEILSMKNGSFRSCEFPSLFAIIRHPQEGVILFDTGYHPEYNRRVKWPENIYPLISPGFISKNQTAAQQLKTRGIAPAEVNWIVISHFHGDHIAGLKDFKKAKFLCRKSAFQNNYGKSAWRNLLNAYLPHLLPKDFLKRVVWIDDCRTWSGQAASQFVFSGADLFGDGSLIAIDLPGHKEGQVGLVFNSEKNGKCFMIADASWSLKALREMRPPPRVAGLVFDSSKEYLKTFSKIHTLYLKQPELQLIPSHCIETFLKLSGGLE